MHEIKALLRPERVNTVIHALHELPDMPGITVSTVQGFGRRTDGHVQSAAFGEATMTKLETVVGDDLVDRVVDIIRRCANTGRGGDGKIFVIPVGRAVRIRSGDTGESVL